MDFVVAMMLDLEKPITSVQVFYSNKNTHKTTRSIETFVEYELSMKKELLNKIGS